MPSTTLEDIVDTLRTARLQGEPIAAPTETWPALDADAAFEVQKINVSHAVANGDRLVGYKLVGRVPQRFLAPGDDLSLT
ncbi:hypothetical protein AB4Z38_12185 [Arthrobacter sp. 2RAF6]|uniref:hypothetical protein n=1 Tax=Arthrobacter sp. 2RAF6 TaxID=3233002 RepID=UPI003F9163B0